MRFTDSRRRMPWMWIVLIAVVIAVGFLSFCEFRPSQTTIQKTIVFEAD